MHRDSGKLSRSVTQKSPGRFVLIHELEQMSAKE